MKLMKKSIAIALAAAMVVTAAPANNADAAKKPSIAKKTSVEVGKKVVVKVKNATKKTTVKWSTSNKKVAKITKQVKKGAKASATVKGVKKGTAKIKAVIKAGKKSYKATCKVTVKKAGAAEATNAPVGTANTPAASAKASASASAAASSSPSASTEPTKPAAPTEDPNKTPKPSKTPRPTKTPEPTQMPADNLDFEKADGVRIDNASYAMIEGNSKYMADKDYVEVNDPENQTHGAWAMPENVKVNVGDVVSFRVQGVFKGDNIVRFWIGKDGSGGCTPVELCKTIDEGRDMGEHQYPACYEDGEDGAIGAEIVGASGESTNGKTKLNQMLLGADATTGKFDVTFNLKAGTSQDDTKTDGVSDFSKFVLKGVIGQNINGLIVKNIYVTAINGEPVGSTTDNPGTGEVTGGAIDVDPDEPAGLDLKTVKFNANGSTQQINDDGSVTFTADAFDGVFIPLPAECKEGDSFKIKLVYECDGTSKSARAYLTNGVDVASSNQLNKDEKAKTSFEGVMTATGPSNSVLIKVDSYGNKFSTLTIKKVILEKVGAAASVE